MITNIDCLPRVTYIFVDYFAKTKSRHIISRLGSDHPSFTAKIRCVMSFEKSIKLFLFIFEARRAPISIPMEWLAPRTTNLRTFHTSARNFSARQLAVVPEKPQESLESLRRPFPHFPCFAPHSGPETLPFEAFRARLRAIINKRLAWFQMKIKFHFSKRH